MIPGLKQNCPYLVGKGVPQRQRRKEHLNADEKVLVAGGDGARTGSLAVPGEHCGKDREKKRKLKRHQINLSFHQKTYPAR